LNKTILSVFSFVFVASQPVIAQNFELLDTKYSSGIESLILGTDKETLITGHLDGKVCFWDVETFTITKTIQDRMGTVNSILFNEKGDQFVTSGDGATLGVYEYPSGKLLYKLIVPSDHNAFACFSKDGNTIFFGGYDNNRKFDSQNNVYEEPYAALWKVKNQANAKSEIAFSDENRYGTTNSLTDGNVESSGRYCVYTRNSELMFYDITNKKIGYKVFIKGILNNLTPVKDRLYVWGDRYLHLLDLEQDKYVIKKSILAGTREGTYGYSKMVLSENGKLLVTGDDGNYVNIWDPNTLDKKQQLIGHTDLCRTFVFCKQDSILCTGGYDGKLMIWGNKKPEPVKDTTPVVTDVVFTDNNIPVTIKDRTVELQTTVTVTEPEFDIDIYDRSVVDGDSISLNINGEWILQEYMVVKTKLRIHVKLNKLSTNNYLILYAHNLGEISPNTAAVQMVIGGKEYKLTLTSDLQKSGALNFLYQPK
jgi:WD40 repeat protein